MGEARETIYCITPPTGLQEWGGHLKRGDAPPYSMTSLRALKKTQNMLHGSQPGTLLRVIIFHQAVGLRYQRDGETSTITIRP